jgi:hypothetical protein
MPLTLSQSRRRFSLSRTIPAIAEANAVLTEFGRSRFVGASVKWNHQDEKRCVSQRSSRIVNRNERVSVDPQNIGEIGCHGRDLSLRCSQNSVNRSPGWFLVNKSTEPPKVKPVAVVSCSPRLSWPSQSGTANDRSFWMAPDLHQVVPFSIAVNTFRSCLR